MYNLTFYTDGSCVNNGKAGASGGYGVVGVDDEGRVQFVRARSETGTTNNRQELKAILYVMLNYGVKCDDWGQPPVVYSDSAYCVNTFNEWMFNWARNGWIKSDKKVPENLDIIKEYYELIQQGYSINLNHIRGHKGIFCNVIADKLATGIWDYSYVIKNYGTDELKEKILGIKKLKEFNNE